MTALIALSHGSRHALAGAGIDRLTGATAARLGVRALSAHLDFTGPTLPEAAVALAGAGVTRAVVVPLLFTDAFHARHDVPAALAEAREVSGIDLLAAAPVGTGDDVAEVLAQRVRDDAPDGAHLVLYSVGSSDEAANLAVSDLAVRIGAATGRSIDAIPATGGPGAGPAAVIGSALGHRRVHLLPLFITRGLLLDNLTDRFGHIAAATGAELTASAPLETGLAGVVATRHRAALAAVHPTFEGPPS